MHKKRPFFVHVPKDMYRKRPFLVHIYTHRGYLPLISLRSPLPLGGARQGFDGDREACTSICSERGKTPLTPSPS